MKAISRQLSAVGGLKSGDSGGELHLPGAAEVAGIGREEGLAGAVTIEERALALAVALSKECFYEKDQLSSHFAYAGGTGNYQQTGESEKQSMLDDSCFCFQLPCEL